jgi:integrase
METKQATEPDASTRPRRRRARGQRGYCYERGGKGKWTIVYRTREGKQKWEGGFGSKKAASARLIEVLAQIEAGKFIDVRPMLFAEFCDSQLEVAKAARKPSTWGSYRSAAEKYLKPQFGEWEVRDITPPAVQQFVNELVKKDLSRKFIKNVLSLLHKLFEDAMDLKLAGSNPAHKIKIDREDDAEERHMPTREDVTRTFTHLRPVYQALLATAAMTGARRAELLGLYWEDIDWKKNAIDISRSLQRVTKRHIASFRRVERIGQTGLVMTSLNS